MYLYHGVFNQSVLIDFIGWMRTTKRGEVAPLASYDWSRVGRDLGEFIELIRSG
jgi:hypothetical protein